MVQIVSYYTSIEEAEADIGETETKSVAPSATMTPVFIRSGNTTKVQMYLRYEGIAPAYIVSIKDLEIWEDNLNPITKELFVSAASIYRQEPANTLVYFPILEANNIPTSHTHLRVDWGSAQVCVIDYGWVSASDPAGAWEIR